MIPPIIMSDLLKISKDNMSIADYLATYSPYLSDLWTHHGAWIAEYSESVPADIINDMMQEILDFDYKNTIESDIMRFLRLQKHRSHLLIALCDIFGDYPVHSVTQFLSDIATLLIELSFKYAVHDTIKRGKLILPQPEWGQGTGLIVCGMGKLGAFELNYSSDIDICVFFDTEALPESDPYMLQDGYIKVTQNIVKLLSHQTADGYVYRTDLRLRPDPASTKVAISLRSAEQYYEQSGQNWERAAWIKARFICGDPVSWVKFQTMMRPFIWRKSLDYAAIQDIQSIKRQLHSHYKQQDIKVSGHDIKIGRGGIREIELFCQTQQLIGGGRDLRLRVNTTFDALDALVVKQWVTAENADILKHAYCLFRKIEHRLQMVGDMQTHLIPTDTYEFEQIAKFCDYENSADFIASVTEHLNQVVRISNSLFAKEKPLAIEEGNLVFTGHDDDPSTLKTLENMGFKRPEYVTATVRKWHGAYRAMRSSKARELLTEITPIMLKKMVQTHDADTAIMKMDDFLEKLPSGVGFFSYLLNNDALLDLMIDIMGSAPDLADFLARYPETFDIMSDANFYNPPDNIKDFKQEFSYRASANIPLDKVLNLLRRFNREQKFRIGIAVLRNHLSYGDIGKYFSALAQCCLELVVHYVIKEFCDKNKINQQICEKNFAIIAMGSFGADEMNAASDLDLLMVYDADSDESIDNPAIHYNKLGQRLISALTLHTQDGILYDVDMRLRPSGHSGSLVVSVERFENYQKHDAHIWEHLALMRARPVMGTDILKDKISNIIHTILSMPKDKSYIKDNVHDMREKLLEHRKALNIWDIKLEHGGIFDISFIAQTLGLIHAEQYPDILHHNTLRIIEKLYLYQIITHNHFEILSQSWDIFQKILNLFALTKVNLQDLSDLSNIPTTLKERIAHILNLYDEADIKNMEHSIKNIYFSVQSLYKVYIH